MSQHARWEWALKKEIKNILRTKYFSFDKGFNDYRIVKEFMLKEKENVNVTRTQGEQNRFRNVKLMEKYVFKFERGTKPENWLDIFDYAKTHENYNYFLEDDMSDHIKLRPLHQEGDKLTIPQNESKKSTSVNTSAARNTISVRNTGNASNAAARINNNAIATNMNTGATANRTNTASRNTTTNRETDLRPYDITAANYGNATRTATANRTGTTATTGAIPVTGTPFTGTTPVTGTTGLAGTQVGGDEYDKYMKYKKKYMDIKKNKKNNKKKK